jgi:hypothetical protein
MKKFIYTIMAGLVVLLSACSSNASPPAQTSTVTLKQNPCTDYGALDCAFINTIRDKFPGADSATLVSLGHRACDLFEAYDNAGQLSVDSLDTYAEKSAAETGVDKETIKYVWYTASIAYCPEYTSLFE